MSHVFTLCQWGRMLFIHENCPPRTINLRWSRKTQPRASIDDRSLARPFCEELKLIFPYVTFSMVTQSALVGAIRSRTFRPPLGGGKLYRNWRWPWRQRVLGCQPFRSTLTNLELIDHWGMMKWASGGAVWDAPEGQSWTKARLMVTVRQWKWSLFSGVVSPSVSNLIFGK